MLAAIGEVQEELHRIQSRLNVLRLAVEGIAAEYEKTDDPVPLLELRTISQQIESSLGILDTTNDALTRTYCCLDSH